MNVFDSNFNDKEEQERIRMGTRKFIERRFPEPKFKPKFVRRSCKDFINAYKMTRGKQSNEQTI